MEIRVRILESTGSSMLEQLFKDIGVHKGGFSIMAAKSRCYLIYLSNLPSPYANILKQEFLSAGGDFALPQDSLTTRRNLGGIIIANFSQINRVLAKLTKQPSFLKRLGRILREAISNYQRQQYSWSVRGSTLRLRRPLIMGIINVTPDSFSGDGLLVNKENFEQEVKRRVKRFIQAGAGIIDVGGESSRPGAAPVSAPEEIKRVIPVIKIIKKHFPRVLISLDTYKASVAQAGIKAGVNIINDITGLRSRKMREVISRFRVGAIVMHMQGKPSNMQANPFYKDVVSEIYDFFSRTIRKCESDGISRNQLVLDPGIGFGKRVRDNIEIIRRLGEFKTLGLPLMLGVSRKSFIGTLTNKPVEERLTGTIASCVLGVVKGAVLLRVHDVEEVKDSILVANHILYN